MSVRPTRSSIWISRAWRERAKILGVLWISALAVPVWRVARWFTPPTTTALIGGGQYASAIFVCGSGLYIDSPRDGFVNLRDGSTADQIDDADEPHFVTLAFALRGWPHAPFRWLETRLEVNLHLPNIRGHEWTADERRRVAQVLALNASWDMPDRSAFEKTEEILANSSKAEIVTRHWEALGDWVAFGFRSITARGLLAFAVGTTLALRFFRRSTRGRAYVRQWHVRRGICAGCGYPSDYTLVRCPECGQEQ